MVPCVNLDMINVMAVVAEDANSSCCFTWLLSFVYLWYVHGSRYVRRYMKRQEKKPKEKQKKMLTLSFH